jgi:hypothetical protein
MRLSSTPDPTPITLVSSSGEGYQIPANYWRAFLSLAAFVGAWEPAGTAAPDGWGGQQPWRGDYEPDSGQSVTPADAAALAGGIAKVIEAVGSLRPAEASDILSAVERCVPGRPEPFRPGRKSVTYAVVPGATREDPTRDAGVVARMKELAAFCRQGAFRIGEVPPTPGAAW